ncbi:cupin domain-containing protein [Bacterioplanes sanyensis]|uniref:cupin domain-containing protein n=1 Tax=Bacterioplanes sanyensis TaxID=1249553 RepID=UPI00357141DA
MSKLRCCSPPTQWVVTSHATDNDGAIIRGELTLTVQGRRQHFTVGDWYHVPAEVEHAAEFEQDTDEIECWCAKR